MSRSHTMLLALAVFALSGGQLLAAEPAPSLGGGLALSADLKIDSIKSIDDAVASDMAVLGLLRLGLRFDTEQAGLWRGGNAYTSVHATFGDDASSIAGDLQGTSNINADDSIRIYEAWFEQRLGDGLTALAGRHDYNTEFDVVGSAADLLNSSFGIGPDVAQVGPSIFPKTHLGFRLRYSRSERFYVQAAAYDGLPYQSGLQAGLEAEDGRFYGAEGGWTFGSEDDRGLTRIAIGGWHFDARLPSERGGIDDGLSGRYLIAEYTVEAGVRRALSLFLRVGDVVDPCMPVRSYLGGGVRLASPLRSRPLDAVTLGIARANIFSVYREGDRRASAETTWELTWVAQLTPWLAVQPDLQFVQHPSGSVTRRDTTVAGLRLVFSY